MWRADSDALSRKINYGGTLKWGTLSRSFWHFSYVLDHDTGKKALCQCCCKIAHILQTRAHKKPFNSNTKLLVETRAPRINTQLKTLLRWTGLLERVSFMKVLKIKHPFSSASFSNFLKLWTVGDWFKQSVLCHSGNFSRM